ncbi:acyl-CoA thioester hydrolase [Candidatus Gastranaerophilus sp. (ex Termes propinquus)]|nr:acyl-CoA thioester hydrolase [Candidatus Gastranaerophilus sp. (ex Termes propinquus)]
MSKVYFESTSHIEVPFYDLDPMNIVWHGNYIKYLEVARCELLEKLNYSYVNMKEDGFAYPVATMDLKFIKPATFGQKLEIVTKIVELEPCLIMKYTIFDERSREKLFSAKTMQICIDTKTGKSLYSAPQGLLERTGNV